MFLEISTIALVGAAVSFISVIVLTPLPSSNIVCTQYCPSCNILKVYMYICRIQLLFAKFCEQLYTMLAASLCLLLWSLMEVHSQTAPYVCFMNETLPNHSYVNLTLVGTDSGDPGNTVRCITDLNSCCSGSQGPHRGDWYFPDGTRLPFSGGGDIAEAREAQRVDIRRWNNANTPSGIYRCDIATDAVRHEYNISVRETVYIGLYSTGGEEKLCPQNNIVHNSSQS